MKLNRFVSPLRYPGGKSKLAYYVLAVIESNGLIGGHYIEPFAGGAGVALQLLLSGKVNSIHINDFDPAVYAFWKSCTDFSEQLCDLIENTPINMDEWYKQREIINQDSLELNTLDLGFAAFFMNRANRSGILKAGVIGGLQQSGRWKLDARFNKEELIKRIIAIAEFKDSITVTNKDAVMLLEGLGSLDNKTLMYLDPPYYVKGQGLYRNFYEHSDHIEIAEQLKGIKNIHWIVSYDNSPAILDMYSDFRSEIFDLQYTAQQKRVGSEIMIYGDNVKIPAIKLGK